PDPRAQPSRPPSPDSESAHDLPAPPPPAEAQPPHSARASHAVSAPPPAARSRPPAGSRARRRRSRPPTPRAAPTGSSGAARDSAPPLRPSPRPHIPPTHRAHPTATTDPRTRTAAASCARGHVRDRLEQDSRSLGEQRRADLDTRRGGRGVDEAQRPFAADGGERAQVFVELADVAEVVERGAGRLADGGQVVED